MTAPIRTAAKARRNLLLLAPVALFPLIGIGILFFFKDSSLKRAAADQGIYTAQTSPAVAAAIGLPIEPGWPIHGKAQANRSSGTADLEIQLRGSRSQGTLYERADKSNGQWRLCSLLFQPAHAETITLIDSSSTHCLTH